MTLSNLSPAERIVAHENKIAENIQQINTNEQLIETQEAKNSNNGKRAFQLATELNQSSQTLQVISLSKAAVDKKIIEPPVSIISVAITGACEKGKPSVATASANEKELERSGTGQYCPIIKVDKAPINIAMPGTSSSPLNFQAFCPDPPASKFFNWAYLFKNMFMPSK